MQAASIWLSGSVNLTRGVDDLRAWSLSLFQDSFQKCILGLYGENGKENGNYYSISGLYGIMEKKIETTIVHWGYIRRMENKMETAMLRDSSRQETPLCLLCPAPKKNC